MSRITLLSLLLVGCGASCPEPTARNDNEDRTGGGSDVEPADPTPASTAFAGFDGRWYFVEPDDDEVELVMEIQGASGTIREGREDQATPMTLELRPNGMALITFGAPGREPRRAFLVPRGPHSVDAFQFGDDDALIGRREGPLPAFLQGRWTLTNLREPRTIEMHVEGRTARVNVAGDLRVIDLVGLAREGPTVDLVGQRADGRGAEMNWLRLNEVEPGVYLLREGNDDAFTILHRPGAAPAWVAEARRPQHEPRMLEAPPAEAAVEAAPPETR